MTHRHETGSEMRAGEREAPKRPQERPAALDATRGPEGAPEAITGELSAPREASEADANPAPRPWTPDSHHDDGSTTLVLKRCCNGCGTQLGDIIARDVNEHGELTDVRDECAHCRPLAEAEAAGCKTWQILRRDLWEIDGELDELGVFTKGYTQTVDGKLRLVGLRVGERPNHVIAFFDDWLIWHPDGRFTVHRAPATTTEGAPA